MSQHKSIPMIHIINPLTPRNHPIGMPCPSINTITYTSSMLAEIWIIFRNGMFEIQILRSRQNLYVTPVRHNNHSDLSHPIEMRLKTIQYSCSPKGSPVKMNKKTLVSE